MTKPERTIQRESLILRIVWMLLFLLVWQIAVPLLALIVIAQLLYRLFFGAPSSHFMSFGDSLSQYLAQIGRFAVFNTDAKPWPVADWPQAHVADGETAHDPQAKKTAEKTVNAPPAAFVEPTVSVKTADVLEEVQPAVEKSATHDKPSPDEPKS